MSQLALAAWPQTAEELSAHQHALSESADALLRMSPWTPGDDMVVGGCFVAFGRPGAQGERAWASAVAWRPRTLVGPDGMLRPRRSGDTLRGRSGSPRQATDVDAQSVVTGVVAASYVSGLLALRQGPLLEEAIGRLPRRPDVIIVDAAGLDHPRRAGLAVQLGAVVGAPTVGVTHRRLLGSGAIPMPLRGSRTPVTRDGKLVGYWLRTRQGARPVLAHAAWRTSPEIAADVVLLSSTEAARTPIPLQEARRVAREARAKDRAIGPSQ